MTQKERQERSRREILRAAMEEFGAHGYDAVSMENICARHGISKGMMYHYYSNKDELFLLCVETIFRQLQKEIEPRARSLVEEETLYAIRDFCLLREDYFQRNPQQKLIFETALLRPPRQLAEAIHTLHRPLYEVNQRFFHAIAARMTLRPGLSGEKVTRYLECVNTYFWQLAAQYRAETGTPVQDVHSLFQVAEELLNLTLFGVARQPD